MASSKEISARLWLLTIDQAHYNILDMEDTQVDKIAFETTFSDQFR